MNRISKILSTVIVAGLSLPLISGAQETETNTKKSRTEVTSDGRTTTTTRTTTERRFTPDVRTKAFNYFETYKTEPHGLPPALATAVKVERIPAEWRTTTLERGYVIPEAERDYLAPVPSDLVEVLPQQEESLKYYLMGSQLVTVDTSKMAVVDSVKIPTIQYTKTGGPTTNTTRTEVAPDGSTSTTTTKTTFTPELRTKVVRYFETYKTRPYGLPPTIVEKVQVERVPAEWKTTTIERGYVIPEEQRTLLAPAPSDLVEVLPRTGETTNYYMMGSNVVAVDTAKMVVVDSVKIPTIKFQAVETSIDPE